MKTKRDQLIIFDIQNEQKDYSMCLEFIKTYEDESKTIVRKVDELARIIANKKILLREFNEKASYRWIEEPIQKNGQSIEESQKCFEQKLKDSIVLDKKVLNSLLRERKNLHYHLRIHMKFEGTYIKQGNLVHLQYLALLLKRLESKGFFQDKLRKEVSVFFVPASSEIYPFLDENRLFDAESYNIVSQYLRLVSKTFRGVIFCADNKKKRIKVHALESHSVRGCETYFPVILVDNIMYNKLFSENMNIKYFEALKGRKKNSASGNFGEAANINPSIAMPDFITKTAYKRILSIMGEHVEDVFKVLHTCSEITIMKFCLFAFLITNDRKIEEIWKLAEEIEKGIRQIVQNSIQHSEIHECVFSFYLHEKKATETVQSFVQRISEQYPSISIKSEQDKMAALEIFISDLNEKQDMLDSFQRNLQEDLVIYSIAEKDKFSGHQALIDNIKNVSIRNLFSEFTEDDMKEAWNEFRKQDIVAHVGLSLFGLTAEKCKAAIKVISCKYPVFNERNQFYKAYGTIEGHNYSMMDNTIIPGTQFSVLIPVRRWSQVQTTSLGQLDLKNEISEDYESFAQYIDYEEERISIKRRTETNDFSGSIQNGRSMGDRKDKNNAVILWYKFWKMRLRKVCEQLNKEKKIYNHDFGNISNDVYFKDEDYIEVCLKGLIMSLNEIDTQGNNLYFAISNLPKGFIKAFCNIASLIGMRTFPENVQLYLHESTTEKEASNHELLLTGKNYTQAMYRAYILSIEHGDKGCSYQDYKKTAELHKKIVPYSEIEENKKLENIRICPFDVLLHIHATVNETIFEKKIRLMAENELDGMSTGYKLNHTHMRLGSKVHIESFYEMSFLFYRTYIANRIAFLILKDIQKDSDSKLDLKKDAIFFYGYASYSKAILTSLTEILRFWRTEGYRGRVGFASYQHNLQSDSNEIQMYFGLESDELGLVNRKNKLVLKESVKVIQIVPISSTLTTFGKMWSEFLGHLQNEKNEKQSTIYGNYTVFWVVDRGSRQPAVTPSSIEKKYWKKVSVKKIETNFPVLKLGGCNHVRYFISSAVIWHDPLKCPQCFPQKVINELPLVETDPTSTVPAQQIRNKTNEHIPDSSSKEFNESINRLLKLENCIVRGHIVRRQNHYQYYIDTQRYFYNVKEDVMEWLRKLRKEAKLFENDSPVLHIIFSPEHNTNVGFAQYVNTYYFGGLAEIVSINVDKEYRTNFVCEHAALMKMIEHLHISDYSENDFPVRFYFVDDTIITGETLEKANSFLHSLLPSNNKKIYHANLFKKIFLLVDRLSNDTKRMYVEKMEENFHSFIHIDVSNIRTQGDSCVGCKLEQNTRKMFKRSATRRQAAYWATKLYDYRVISFDDLDELEKIDRKQSFDRMMIYHMLQNVIIKNGKAYDVGDAYDTILDLMEWFLNEGEIGEIYGYAMLFSQMNGLDGIKNILKIICRPFFTFDYKIRLQVLTLYIFLTESLLGTRPEQILCEKDRKSSRKLFLYEQGRKDRTIRVKQKIENCLETVDSKLDFLSNYMFEGLTDMGSTYLLRKQSLEKIYMYIENIPGKILEKLGKEVEKFWRDYILNIHRILSNTRDETKELWLEYLYSTGEEIDSDKRDFSKIKQSEVKEFPEIYNAIMKDNKSSSNNNDNFKRAILELFLQNTGVSFDGIEKKNEINASDEYFMESWNEMRKLGQWVLKCHGNINDAVSESKLFSHLENKHDSNVKNKRNVKKWYGKFLTLITNIGKEKYGIEAEDINIILMTENINYEDEESKIEKLDIIDEWIGKKEGEKPVERYIAKSRLGEALIKNGKRETELEKNGYFIRDDCEGESYFILFFDNPEIEQEKFNGNELKSLARVFLYMNITKQNKKSPIGIRYIMRDILTYRNRLLRILEQDFYGDTFINYARTNEERNILSHEKAASHSASTDDEISVELFVRKDLNNKNIYSYLNDNKKAHWLLIRNYTNNQIAKLFNRSFNDETEGEIPPLYLNKNVSCEKAKLFGEKLTFFKELQMKGSIKEQDGRFQWIQEIMDLKIDLDDNAEFVVNKKNESYNLEYFKCIIVDTLISAIKFQSYQQDDFLLRIEDIMDANDYQDDGKKVCSAKIYREESSDKEVDYLVIENPVEKMAHCLADWEKRNELINMRLNDPLDFVDGHMSLLAIKRYIENLDATKEKCCFKYSLIDNNCGEQILGFKTCLPVLRREDN